MAGRVSEARHARGGGHGLRFVRRLSSGDAIGAERSLLDVTKLDALTEATMPALTKLCYTVQVELELQKSVGSVDGASQDLQES